MENGSRYRCWLQEQSFEHPADQIVLQELLEDVRLGEERRGRIERAIEEFLPSWGLAPIVEALQALRGIELVTAVTFVVEVGDIARFESPRRLMAYIGLVPGERSTGETVRRGSITKMGNARLRHLLVESAWTYRHPRGSGRRSGQARAGPRPGPRAGGGLRRARRRATGDKRARQEDHRRRNGHRPRDRHHGAVAREARPA